MAINNCCNFILNLATFKTQASILAISTASKTDFNLTTERVGRDPQGGHGELPGSSRSLGENIVGSLQSVRKYSY